MELAPRTVSFVAGVERQASNGGLQMDQLDENEIQALVSAALDQAADNGYDESQADPEQVAVSLVDDDADIEELVWDQFDGDETILIPYIEVWQQRQSN